MFSAYFDVVEKVAKAESLEEGTQLNMYRAIVDDMIKVTNLEGDTRQNAGPTKEKLGSAQVQPGGMPPAGGGAGGPPV